MKAEDLMIGDLVIRKCVPEEPMRVYDIKTSSGIAYLDQDGRGVTEKFENIEPISLTKEILLKSGFKEFSGGGCIIKELDNDEIPTLYIWDGNDSIYVVDEYSTNKYTYIKDCKYVHEFQHELKSCRIEKYIVL